MDARIAVADITAPNWTASGTFTEILLRALRSAAGPETDIVVLGDGAGTWQSVARSVPLAPSRLWPGEARLRRRLRIQPARSAVERYCEMRDVTALLQMVPDTMRFGTAPYKRITWIPDFQHIHYPSLFSAAERTWRDAVFAQAARYSDAVLLTSQAANADYTAFAPRFRQKARVIRFPSLYAYAPPNDCPAIQPAYYGVPSKFVLVANQFWSHKNHTVVIEAVAILARKGVRIPVVMTGLPADYRDPGNATVSTVLQRVATSGLAGQVIPLGLVPRDHLTALLRCAAIVVQPSRFEGWGALVHDATALGRPLICSDIAIHRETAPQALGFFAPDDADALATILECYWNNIEPGPNLGAEHASLDRQRGQAKASGEALLALMM